LPDCAIDVIDEVGASKKMTLSLILKALISVWMFISKS
jgi:ATP-dependent Clp protease ATP-binding subunit ClpA